MWYKIKLSVPSAGQTMYASPTVNELTPLAFCISVKYLFYADTDTFVKRYMLDYLYDCLYSV